MEIVSVVLRNSPSLVIRDHCAAVSVAHGVILGDIELDLGRATVWHWRARAGVGCRGATIAGMTIFAQFRVLG